MMKEKPPPTNSRLEFEVWLCERHNEVNIRLDKPLFNCSCQNIRETYKQKDFCQETGTCFHGKTCNLFSELH